MGQIGYTLNISWLIKPIPAEWHKEAYAQCFMLHLDMNLFTTLLSRWTAFRLSFRAVCPLLGRKCTVSGTKGILNMYIYWRDYANHVRKKPRASSSASDSQDNSDMKYRGCCFWFLGYPSNNWSKQSVPVTSIWGQSSTDRSQVYKQ